MKTVSETLTSSLMNFDWRSPLDANNGAWVRCHNCCMLTLGCDEVETKFKKCFKAFRIMYATHHLVYNDILVLHTKRFRFAVDGDESKVFFRIKWDGVDEATKQDCFRFTFAPAPKAEIKGYVLWDGTITKVGIK